MPDIPSDVVLLILDQFALNQNQIGRASCAVATCPGLSCNNCSVRTLRACSQVCKAWQPLCQQRLFKSAKLLTATDIHALRSLIRNSPHLAVYIADLDIGDPISFRPSMRTDAAVYDLPSLPGVQNLTWAIPGDAPPALLAFLPTVLPNVTFLCIAPQSIFHDVLAVFDLSRAFPRVSKLTIDHLRPYDAFAFPPARLREFAAPTAVKGAPIPLTSLSIKDAHHDADGVDLPTLWCARQAAAGFRDVRGLASLNIDWLEQPCHMEPLNALFREVRGTLACLKLTLHGPEYGSPFLETVVKPFPAFDLSHNTALRKLEICVTQSPIAAKALEGPVALLRSLPMLDDLVLALLPFKGEPLVVTQTWRDIIQLFSAPRFGKPCTLIVATDSTTLPTCVHDAHRALADVGVDLNVVSGGRVLLGVSDLNINYLSPPEQ